MVKAPDEISTELDPALSVVVPVWNEAWCIYETLTEISKFLDPVNDEIIVADDGSTDNTRSEVARWIRDNHGAQTTYCSLARHRGKGSAVQLGVLRSRGSLVVIMDADLDIPAIELRHLTQLTRRPDEIIVGSKADHRSTMKMGRRIVSSTFSSVVKAFFQLPISDTQTGLKLFPGQWIRETISEIDCSGFLYDLELIALAHSMGLPIRQETVAFTPMRSENRVGFRDLVASIAELVRVKRKFPLVRRSLTAKRPHENFNA